MTATAHHELTVDVDEKLPAVRFQRDFDAPVANVLRAHLDPDLFVRWVGPDDMSTTVDYWDARTGGSWRFVNERGEETYAFHGSFHEVTDDRIVQTFAFEGMPDNVLLERMTLEDLGGGRTRLRGFSLADSFEARDQMVASGMEGGMADGYRKLDAVLAEATEAVRR